VKLFTIAAVIGFCLTVVGYQGGTKALLIAGVFVLLAGLAGIVVTSDPKR
jgi:hypothetical protein